MKYLKIVGILLAVYVVIVVLFESLIGYYQPADESTLVITTSDEDGTTNDRVLSTLSDDGKIYVAANHWPRSWYNDVLAHPEVSVTVNGAQGDYLAVSVSDAEHDGLMTRHALPLVVKFLTGFPPRYFVRLDPR